jgi:hypothetical protein
MKGPVCAGLANRCTTTEGTSMKAFTIIEDGERAVRSTSATTAT